jgi:hypothetical protein
MPVFWTIVGVVLVAIVWAIISSTSRKAEVRTEPMAPTSMPALEPERELPKAKSWQEARTASVSKNFGRGGAPTGSSTDFGKANTAGDDDIERLKKAKPFEPRAVASSTLHSDDD